MSDDEASAKKPTLHLLGPPFTAERLAALFQKLTGRAATEIDMDEFRRLEAEMADDKQRDESDK